jgi:hypothetical protein
VPLAAVGKDYLTCAAGPSQGTCSNKRSMRRPDRKTLILDGRKDWLMAPELVKEFIAEFPPGGEPAQPQPGADLGLQRRELEEVNRKLWDLIEAIAEGPHAPGPSGEARRAGAGQDAHDQIAGPRSAVSEAYRRSVKVVAGARNHLDLLLSA